MYKEILRNIAGIGAFPLVSLLLFVFVFTIVVIRAIGLDRSEAGRLAALPLDDDGPRAAAHQEGGR